MRKTAALFRLQHACMHTSAPASSAQKDVSNVFTRCAHPAVPSRTSPASTPTFLLSPHSIVSLGEHRIRRLTSGLPIIAGQTSAAGRGIFALRDIPPGELIHKSSPVALHAPPGRIAASVCAHCLRNLGLDAAPDGFCCRACAEAAQAGYGGLQAKLGEGYARYRRDCEEKGLLFPLIAARLACDVAAGATRGRRGDHTVARYCCHFCCKLAGHIFYAADAVLTLTVAQESNKRTCSSGCASRRERRSSRRLSGRRCVSGVAPHPRLMCSQRLRAATLQLHLS